jgi:coenzyme F420 hydrogenase subunit beta
MRRRPETMTALPDAPTSPSLRRVAKGDLCSGCGACAAIGKGKVTMETAPPGFLRPVQTDPLTDHEERTLAAVCPGLGQRVIAGTRTDDILWGPSVSMETGWASDPGIRHAGSSGAALTAILLHLLDVGEVDSVVQTRADDDLPIGNMTDESTSDADVVAASGSRYAPSAPLAGLAGLIGAGGRHAFVGKPCDAAALRAWAALDPAVGRTFPVILSFFCAGVPSHRGAEQVLAALGTTLNDTARFRFRGNGWPGRAVATLRDGSERSMSYHDSWGKILSRHVQHRCKICADGTGMAADIVCADAWEADERGYPLFEETDGISLVMARTPEGARVLAAARDAGRVQTRAFDAGTLAAIQPGQRERRRGLWARLSALRLCGKPVPVYRGLHLLAAARQNRASRNLRNFLGTLRRTLRPAGRQ